MSAPCVASRLHTYSTCALHIRIPHVSHTNLSRVRTPCTCESPPGPCCALRAASAAALSGCALSSDGANPLDFHHVEPAKWDGTSGATKLGYDWSLPPGISPAPNGLYTLSRSFDVLPKPPYKWNNQWPNTANPGGGPGAAGLPSNLAFPANPVFCMWVAWKQVEPTKGNYDFSAIVANTHEAVSKGWSVGIRLLTSRVDEAATYLSGSGLKTKYSGTSYDPADTTVCARATRTGDARDGAHAGVDAVLSMRVYIYMLTSLCVSACRVPPFSSSTSVTWPSSTPWRRAASAATRPSS